MCLKHWDIQWDQNTDEFLFIPAELKDTASMWTKRTILSDISKLFDPLGWLSPCIILAKIFMQQLWLLQLGWDETLPANIVDEWVTIRNQFMTTCSVRIPRWIGYKKETVHNSLQGFSDASKKACASVVYIRIIRLASTIVCKLIAAKTKVAPLKKTSIPRLEPAVLLASLMNTVKTAINVPGIQQQAWTDSMIVLYWLANQPGRWKTFIANRVATVQEMLPSHSWRHIESEQNPADCASRGSNRQNLEGKNMWWHGPSFLVQSEENWPKHTVITPKIISEERVNVNLAVMCDEPLIKRFSTYERMINVVSICLRWRPHNRAKGYISPKEISTTERKIIKTVQSESFDLEIKCLRTNKTLPTNSTILKLDPFIDEEGVIRVGGRIQLSALPENEKHPIILPQKHHFTKLLIRYMHEEVKHGGMGLTLQKIRQNYWIVSARTAITSVIHQCLTCFRFRKQLLTQKMGNLPAYRVQEGIYPFQYCGVD